MEEKKYDLIAFTDGGLSLDVRVDQEEDTVWLTQDQMAFLFACDRSVISRHIKSIYKEGELSEKSTCAFFARVPFAATCKGILHVQIMRCAKGKEPIWRKRNTT